MSGSLIGGVVGGVIGYIVSGGNPMGAVYGFSLGSAAGGMLFPDHQDGPRLQDLKPQSSEYGRPIPIVYGTEAIGGNVIWASDYIEEESDSGGKGDSSGPTQYSYFGNFAIAFAEGECDIGRMWAGPEKRLIWDGMLIEGGGTVRIYTGSEDQLPDPLIESYLGVGNVPAYRGTCYAVFERFPLVKDGNALPFITAEVGAKASPHGQTPVLVTDQNIPADSFSSSISLVDKTTGWIWVVEEVNFAASVRVQVINDATQSVIKEWTLTPALTPKAWATITTRSGFIANAPGLVFLMVIPWVLSQRRAGLGTFTSGQANADGSVKVEPQFMGWDNMGINGDVLGIVTENPKYPSAIYATDTDVWIAYAADNTAAVHFAYYPILNIPISGGMIEAGEDPNYGEFSTPYQIGMPYHMAGDNDLFGIGGSLGPSGDGTVNFLVMQTLTGTAIHAVRWDIGGLNGKSFDYDPKRKRFVSFSGAFPGQVTTLDAITGEIQSRNLSTATGDTSPVPSPVPDSVTYSKKTDRYLIGASTSTAGTGTTIYIVDPDTLTTEAAVTFEAGAQMIRPLLDPVNNKGAPYVLAVSQNSIKRLYIGGLAAAAPIGLGEIVADLSARAGLTADQIDVSALTDMVDGYVIARQTTVRNAIDALRPAYYFDAVESEGKVKYIKRGGAPVATIDADDLDARNAGDAPGDPLMTTRQMDAELPRVVNVNYLLAATDYSPATKLAKRLVGASGNESTLDLPLVLTDTKAQEVADVNLQVAFVQRLTYAFSLPRKYSFLEPTDPIVVKGNGMRLTKITHTPQGVLKCEAVSDGSTYYTSGTLVTETPANEQTVYIPGTTSLELM